MIVIRRLEGALASSRNGISVPCVRAMRSMVYVQFSLFRRDAKSRGSRVWWSTERSHIVIEHWA